MQRKLWSASALVLTFCISIGGIAAAPRTSPDPSADPERRDLLGEALGHFGASRADLGYRPHASWTRFPNPRQIPYTLPLFEDTFAEPLRLYDLGRTMGNAAGAFLVPGGFDAQPQALHKLLYFLGVDKRITGFRDYSTNLPDGDAARRSLYASLEQAWAFAGGDLEPRSFGKPAGHDDAAALRRQIDAMPADLQNCIARLVDALLDAERWQALGVRNVPAEAMTACHRIRNLGETQGDAWVYYPEIDDAARGLDEASMAYAAMKTAQAAQDARTALRAWWRNATPKDKAAVRDLRFAHRTPIGWVIVSGVGRDVHTERGVLALVDLGGDDTYRGDAGCGADLAPLSVCIDLAGNDVYEATDPTQPAQGSGIFGTGVLIDVEGSDTYTAATLAQGCGFFGTGILVDEGGTDRYRVGTSGQGCGYFGIGLCLDAQGDDDYACDGDAQGFGGVGGGVGVLADQAGRDHYFAEPYASKVDRGDDHSQGKINVSNAQGVGSGRRGDGADGHSWAGGLGAILDLHGNDTYESGNWSLGTGFWFGTGIAFDGGGDDMYRSVYFTQAAGAHYANGALLDEAGNDQHVLYETAGAAMAFGWDYANALFVDKAGDDRYEARIISLGLAQVRSNALFFDLGGDDQYQLGKDQPGMGGADFRDDYAKPDPLAPYNSETTSFGLLLDAGGNDKYFTWEDKVGRVAAPGRTNDTTWQSPAPGTVQAGWRNYGLGFDAANGTVPELMRFDAPSPSPTSAR